MAKVNHVISLLELLNLLFYTTQLFLNDGQSLTDKVGSINGCLVLVLDGLLIIYSNEHIEDISCPLWGHIAQRHVENGRLPTLTRGLSLINNQVSGKPLGNRAHILFPYNNRTVVPVIREMKGLGNP